jgi:hypothetical protein
MIHIPSGRASLPYVISYTWSWFRSIIYLMLSMGVLILKNQLPPCLQNSCTIVQQHFKPYLYLFNILLLISYAFTNV